MIDHTGSESLGVRSRRDKYVPYNDGYNCLDQTQGLEPEVLALTLAATCSFGSCIDVRDGIKII